MLIRRGEAKAQPPTPRPVLFRVDIRPVKVEVGASTPPLPRPRLVKIYVRQVEAAAERPQSGAGGVLELDMFIERLRESFGISLYTPIDYTLMNSKTAVAALALLFAAIAYAQCPCWWRMWGPWWGPSWGPLWMVFGFILFVVFLVVLVLLLVWLFRQVKK